MWSTRLLHNGALTLELHYYFLWVNYSTKQSCLYFFLRWSEGAFGPGGLDGASVAVLLPATRRCQAVFEGIRRTRSAFSRTWSVKRGYIPTITQSRGLMLSKAN